MLAERYPELAGTRAWLQASDWISRYGPLALFGLMALDAARSGNRSEIANSLFMLVSTIMPQSPQ